MNEFDDIFLHNEELSFLKKLKKGISFRAFSPNDALIANHLVSVQRGSSDSLVGTAKITDKGKRYLAYARKKKIEKWLPIIISAAALLKSFDSEIISAVQLLVQLLKSPMAPS